MKKIIFLVVFLFSCLYSGTIKVATTSDLYNAINELVYEFNQINPDTKVQITLGSSGKFAAQIVYNAPFDIFLSAEMELIETLYKKNFSVYEPKEYARGKLIMISSEKLDFSKNMNLLLSKNIKRIVVLNPKTSPYGKSTLEAINNLNIFQNIENKIVYAETASQALVYTLENADIGFIPNSAIYLEGKMMFKENENWAFVNDDLYAQTKQGIALLKRAKNNPEAIAFYNFILSSRAKEILRKYGYITNE